MVERLQFPLESVVVVVILVVISVLVGAVLFAGHHSGPLRGHHRVWRTQGAGVHVLGTRVTGYLHCHWMCRPVAIHEVVLNVVNTLQRPLAVGRNEVWHEASVGLKTGVKAINTI